MSKITQNLKEFKDIIIDHFHRNYTKNDIARMLENEYRIKIAERTVKKRLTEWQINKKIKTEQNVIDLKFRFVKLFYKSCLNDDDIFTVLNKKNIKSIKQTLHARARNSNCLKNSKQMQKMKMIKSW